jgi:uncharacterized membrane protein/uncharacterized membrane protein YeaQ/YmgE (transglycosylase-associated protein family)
MEALTWLATGMVSGWLAGKLMKGRDYGWLGNLLLGVIGSLLGGWIFDVMVGHQPQGVLRHAGVALLGSMIVLAVARRLKPVARQGRKVIGEAAGVADLESTIARLEHLERAALKRVLGRDKPRDLNASFEEQMTFGDRIADQVARFGGSWTFIGVFVLGMLVWMILNTEMKRGWDPYPFILLNLCLSCVAAMQAPIIMMSQNRQAAKDRLMATNDYEVTLRSEMQIQSLRAHFDELRERDWAALVDMQRRQIEMLERLLREREGA